MHAKEIKRKNGYEIRGEGGGEGRVSTVREK